MGGLIETRDELIVNTPQKYTALMVSDDKAHYYPDSAWFVTKLIADKTTHKLLGVQVLGPGAVDKMVDIAVTGISMGAALEDFDNLDLAYAPPFSTAIHPFVQAVYLLENKLEGKINSITPAEYQAGAAKGCRGGRCRPGPRGSRRDLRAAGDPERPGGGSGQGR